MIMEAARLLCEAGWYGPEGLGVPEAVPCPECPECRPQLNCLEVSVVTAVGYAFAGAAAGLVAGCLLTKRLYGGGRARAAPPRRDGDMVA